MRRKHVPVVAARRPLAYRGAMSASVETVLLIFGLVGLGFACGRVGLLDVAVGDALTRFAVGVAMPVLLFRTMASADFHGTTPWALWGAYFTAVGMTWVAGHLVATRIFGRDSRAGIVAGMASAFSNLVLLGLAFSREVFGEAGFEVVSLIIAIHLPVMMGVTVLLLAGEGARVGGRLPLAGIARSFAAQLATNALIVSIVAGLLWRATGLQMPSVMQRLVDTLADVAGPIALFAVGLSLLKFGVRGGVAIAAATAGLKLVFMPAVALVMALAIDLPPASAKVLVVMAGMPIGVNPYLIASRFGVGERLASSAMTISTAAAALTTLFWVAVVDLVF